MKTWVVSGDWQIPFQDHKIIEGLFLPFVSWLKPDGFLWNGDITDCYELSEFSKNPLLKDTLDQEVRESQGYMKRITKIKSIGQFLWNGGNHEDRLRRYMWQHAGRLKINPDDTFDRIFGIKENGFSYFPYGHVIELGSLDVTHGSVVRQHSGWSGKAAFEKRGGSVLVNHTHRMGTYYRTNAKGMHVAVENGCLCRLDPEYVQDPDWQHGFSVVKVADSGDFNVTQVPIVNREFMFYGDRMWEIK